MPGRERLPVCTVPECVPKLYGNATYCNKHLVRFRKHGDPLMKLPAGFQPGDKNPSKSAERRAELSARRKLQVISQATKDKARATMKRRLQEPAMIEKWRKAATGRKLSEETKAKIKATRASKPKKLKTIVAAIDVLFSKYIRTKYADDNGFIHCFTCPTVKPMPEIDCGHFVSRLHKALRWHEENAHPQCWSCNRYHEGRKDVYAVNLQEKYGAGILRALQELKHQPFDFSLAIAADLLVTWKSKYAALIALRGHEIKLAGARLGTIGRGGTTSKRNCRHANHPLRPIREDRSL